MANTYISIDLTVSTGTDDKRVKVSTDDTTAGFLEEKVIAGSARIVLTTVNPGADEDLSVDVDETQINHNNTLNYDINEHRELDDASTTTTSLWSSNKIQTELDTKVDKVSSTDNAVTRFDGTTGAVQDSGVIVDDSDNVTGINDLTIDGDLTVNGTTTSVNSETLDVTDANITVNNGGDQAAADLADAGITVEMSDATNAVVGYDSSTTSKFRVGEVGSESEIVTVNHTQTVVNKTIDADNNTVSNLEVDNLKAGVLSTDLDLAVDDTKLASAQAVKTYVTDRVAEKDDASEITYTPADVLDWDGDVDPGNVDGGLDQLAERVNTAEGSLSTHLDGGAAKHTATSVSFSPIGNIAGTDVQTALAEVDSEKVATVDFSTLFDSDLATKTTDDLTEGTNLYFTDARAHVEVGDIANTDAAFANNVAAPTAVTGLVFSNAAVGSFHAIVEVDRSGDGLYEQVSIHGIQKAADWDITVSAVGDETGLDFTINATGQILYTSSNLTSGGTITFRAETTSI